MSQGGEGDSQNTDNKIATIGWLLELTSHQLIVFSLHTSNHRTKS